MLIPRATYKPSYDGTNVIVSLEFVAIAVHANQANQLKKNRTSMEIIQNAGKKHSAGWCHFHRHSRSVGRCAQHNWNCIEWMCTSTFSTLVALHIYNRRRNNNNNSKSINFYVHAPAPAVGEWKRFSLFGAVAATTLSLYCVYIYFVFIFIFLFLLLLLPPESGWHWMNGK